MKNKGFSEFPIAQLDRFMHNLGNEQFSYEIMKSAYDSDPKIQSIVKDFDSETVTLKTSEMDDVSIKKKNNKDIVGKMAKSAVDLKDL